jgi:hypothetical protein
MRRILASFFAIALAAHASAECGAAPGNSAAAAAAAAESTRPGALAAQRSDDWKVIRVGGDAREEATFDASRGFWRSGVSVIDTPLPEGYPPPTPPGAIELKKYPGVRRAQVTGIRDGDSGFWPLFRHIERHGIAMTSPVEMDYRSDAEGRGIQPDGITMSFLYRRADMNRTGPDDRDRRVQVRDTEPVTVVSLGGRGSYSTRRVDQDVEKLRQWLAQNPEWAVAGEPRALFYNGPTLTPGRKWLEVQIPVVNRKAAAAEEMARKP